jgi:uncharacterized protein with PIN domain
MPEHICFTQPFEVIKEKRYMLLPDGLVGRIQKTILVCTRCGHRRIAKNKEDLISVRKFPSNTKFYTKDGRVYWDDTEAILMQNDNGSILIKKNTENNRRKFKLYEDKISSKIYKPSENRDRLD